MGQSTDGQVGYGMVFEDGYEFPWSGEPFAGEIEEWWRKEQGFIPPENADYQEIFDAEREFDKAHPLPVREINYCSLECPMIILAVPSSCRTANRGCPERLDGGLGLVTEAEKTALRDFCAKYELKPESEEGWYLSSYWG